VRHRLLRQALEVRSLPPPHCNIEQPGVRSCRYLRRSCSDRAPISSLRQNRTGLIITNGADAALRRVLAQGCWTPVESFGVPGGWEAGEPDAEGGFEIAW